MLYRRRLLAIALLAFPCVTVSGTPGSNRPLGTAIADFDSDGRDDLAVLRPGRLEVLRPHRSELRLGFRADVLAAGDFDGDGVVDLVLGERGTATLTTLRGDGLGGFGSPQVTLLPGELTALHAADVNRRDGLLDWLVGVVDAQGPAVFVFEGLEGAVTASPERIPLPAPATALAVGHFNGTYLADVAAACGPELVLIGGRDRKLHTPGSVVADPVLHSWPLSEEASALRTLDGERALGVVDPRGGAHVLRDGALVEEADGFVDRVTLGEDGTVTMTPAAVAATFVVNSTADTVDALSGDGLCADGAGACTLRAALQEANASAGADEITFALGSGTPSIAPASPLPLVTDVVSIRGNTGGATRIELNGTGAGALTNGFYFSAGSSGSLVRSFVINRFIGWGIRLASANNTVEDCWIGMDAAGSTTVQGNATGGVEIFGTSATGNLIGGSAAGTRNVIARSGGPGVRITTDAPGNIVRGNYIGLNPGANVAAANGLDGVHLLSSGAGNRIEKNVISGNTNNGILLEGVSTTGTLIEGNLIGTHGSGLSSIANGQNGILITGTASSNTVGGTTVAQRNVISGNAAAGGDGIELQGSGNGFTGTNIFGNYIGLDAGGTAGLSNGQDGILISGGVTGTAVGAATGTPGSNGGNVTAGNGRHGIRVEGTGTGTSIQGNLIGLRAGGTVAQANLGSGISIAAPSTTVGGALATQRNVVSGGNGIGVVVGGNGTVVQSNFVGTDITGAVRVGGGGVGAADPGSTGITGFVVGGATSAPGLPPGNVIAPSTVGVSLLGPGVQGALVQGNLIGLNASGVAFGGTGNGVSITFGARNNTIGGTTASLRNVISGNFIGVRITDNGTLQNLVQGNYIGTDAAGTAAVPNTTGISIESGAASNTVGGAAATPGAAPGNVISGNTSSGISFASTGTSSAVKGNIIGATSAGMASLPNRSAGIFIGQSAQAAIGGSAAGDRNLISGNAFNATNAGVDCSDCSGAGLWGNWIGVAIDGTIALPNGIGVAMRGPTNPPRGSILAVGGQYPGEGNVISGNQTVGVLASDNDGVGSVLGNFIGVAPDGVSPMGNGSHGISTTGFSGPSVGNLIGATPGACTGGCNVIRFNGGAGISFPYAFARETILGNRISDNAQLGIDLASAGPTANDAGDATFPQNAPVIQVVVRAGNTSIQGTIDTVANTLVNVDVFGNTATDPSGFGEGDVYLGTTTCTTGVGGSCTWTLLVPSAPAFLTATANVNGRGTSEFAATFLDSDGDGFGDTFDVCPGISNPDQIDDDFDGHGNVCDCAPNDGGSFAPVTDIATLTMEPDRQTVSWPSQSQATGTGTLHQLLRGLTTQLPVGTPGETCVASSAANSFTDTSLPAAGAAYWYVVRAKNACATSSYGDATAGPRVSSTCP